MALSHEDAAHVNRICRYLALDDFAHRPLPATGVEARSATAPFDVVAVFGNQVLDTVVAACDLFAQGLARRLLFSGGRGHSTHLLFDNLLASPRFTGLVAAGAVTAAMAEADIMAAVATGRGVPPASVLVERDSTNTGENARFSWQLLCKQVPRVGSILLIQDPVMQRRSVLTLKQVLAGVPQAPLLLSRAVFVPELSAAGILTPASPEPPPWSPERFLSLVLGEVERLRNDANGYGPKGRGFIPAEDVPQDVLASYEFLKTRTKPR